MCTDSWTSWVNKVISQDTEFVMYYDKNQYPHFFTQPWLSVSVSQIGPVAPHILRGGASCGTTWSVLLNSHDFLSGCFWDQKCWFYLIHLIQYVSQQTSVSFGLYYCFTLCSLVALCLQSLLFLLCLYLCLPTLALSLIFSFISTIIRCTCCMKWLPPTWLI